MGNGELLKLSESFHRKIDTTFAAFNKKMDEVVKSGHETEFEVQQVASEVKTVDKKVDDHIENHTEAKRDIKGVVLSVLATVLGALMLALIFYIAGGR
jgi:peptidoglycan hydrolase CwlO-like protein